MVKLILFPLGFVLLWFSQQQLLLRGLRNYETGNLGVWKKVMSGSVNAEVLLAGSSRTWVHFDPKIIEACTGKRTFNIGRDATLPDLQLAFLKTYLRHNRKPDLLVQGMDITMLRQSTNIYNASQYIAYLKEPDLSRSLTRIDGSFRLYECLPMVGLIKTHALRYAIRGLTGRWQQEDHISGYKPHDIPWRQDFEKFRISHSAGVSFPIEPSAVEAIREIVELCRAKGIPIILVYSPEYNESQVLTLNRTEVFGIFKQVAAEYGVPFWDFSDHPLCSQKQYFYNSQHLNQQGATHFSEDFGKRLQERFAGADNQSRLTRTKR